MKYLFPILTALALVMTACSSETKKEDAHDHDHGEHANHSAQHDEALPAEQESNNAPGRKLGLKLNEGMKWSANLETTQGISNMDSILSGPTPTDTAGFRALATKIESEFQNIFAKCTMTGESHNQLHHFIVPMTAMIKTLKTGDLEARQSTHANFIEHLTLYDIYFE